VVLLFWPGTLPEWLQLFAGWLSLNSEMGSFGSTDGDEELVNAAKRGDRQAFSQLVERYEDRIYDLACRTLGDASRAQDVAQEAFIRAWRALGNFKGASKFSSWLYRITLNCSYSELRRRQVRLEPALSENSSDIYAASLQSEVFDRRIEAADLVERLLGALAPIQRSIVVLHYLHGLNCEEISVIINHPVGTIKAYLHRARTKMKYEAENVLKISGPSR
jgi:RNA polymerase sigma-70 factor (ECF subfamily)